MQAASDRILRAPTDLSNFLNCRHLSRLDRDAAVGERERPARYGAVIEALSRRGFEHEQSAELEAKILSAPAG